MPTARVKFTSDYLVETFRRYRQQEHAGRVFPVVRVFMAGACVLIGLSSFYGGNPAIGLICLAACVFFVFFNRIADWRTRHVQRSSPDRDNDLAIEFTEAGVHIHSPTYDTRFEWSVFTSVAHFRDGFLIFRGPRSFQWIPALSLGGASQVVELETLLRANVREHRIIQPCAAPESSGAERRSAESR
jgi:hypothetical protein